MSMVTLDRSPPPFFKQGPSAFTRLLFFSALAILLMVADARWKMTQPVRVAVAVVLQPVQSALLVPVRGWEMASSYFSGVEEARTLYARTQLQLAEQAVRVTRMAQLERENERLRGLLTLRPRIEVGSLAAEVLYDAPDPYTRKVVIDRGRRHGVALGSPVIDERGVLGQVTRVFPAVSEVTLLVDRDQAIPVLNVRTGVRGVAYGDPVTERGSGMELRFMPANTDIREGDLLTTSGVDGLYPSGLPVATVVRVERRADSAFARIYCAPLARTNAARHVVVLTPLAERALPSPPPAPAASSAAGRGRR